MRGWIMKGSFSCVGLAASASLIALAAATPGYAQSSSAAAADEAPVEDIIVTAQFREQRLQDTPLSITAVNSSLLEAREQRSLADVGRFAPNVNVSTGSMYSGNAISAYIRGVGQWDSSFALEPGVGVYLDDVYYGVTYGAVFDLQDLERVEILRGPQGTLAGKNSVGGALKMFTTKPTADDSGSANLTVGRFGRIEGRASFNVKLTDELFARASFLAKRSDGYMDRLDFGCANPGGGLPPSPSTSGSCKVGTLGGTRLGAARLALRYEPAGGAVVVDLAGDFARDDSEAPATKAIFANNPVIHSYDPTNPFGGIPFDSRFLTPPKSRTTYADFCNGGNFLAFQNQVPRSYCPAPKSTAETFGVSGVIEVRLSDTLSLKSITAYRGTDGEFAVDIDGSPLELQLTNNVPRHRQFTQEVRLNGQVGSIADFTLGAFYYKAKQRYGGRSVFDFLLLDYLDDSRISNRSAAAFAHAELHLAPNLDVIGGIRYTDDKKTFEFNRSNLDGSLPSGIPGTPNFLVAGLYGVSNTFSKGQLNYRLGVNYRWSEALMTYAQVSTAYRGGGVNPYPTVPDQVRPFNPEKLTAYEAGFKADIAGNLLRLNGAVFLNDYSGLQIVVTGCPPTAGLICQLYTNAGEAEVKGAELEMLFRPARGLTIDGSVGYLDFKYTSINPASRVTLDMVGPYSTKWQASAGIQYVADLGDAGTLTPRFDWSYLSSFYTEPVNGPYNLVAGRNLFNARLSYETSDRTWNASVGVTNLFDKFYYLSKADGVAAYGQAAGAVGRPREWSISIGRRF